MLQESDCLAKLLSIQCNILLGLKHFILPFYLLAQGEENWFERRSQKIESTSHVQVSN